MSRCDYVEYFADLRLYKSKIFAFVPTDLDKKLGPKVDNVKKNVTFDLEVQMKRDRTKRIVEPKFKGDLVWYRSEVRYTRAWLEAKVVGINSTNTFYDEIDGAVRLANRNQLKMREVKRDDYIYPKVVRREKAQLRTQPGTSRRSVSVDSPRASPEKEIVLRRSKRVGRKPERLMFGSL